MLLEDILMFFLVSEGMSLRWYLWQDAFMDIIYRGGGFFENRLHTEAKWSN